MKRIRLHVKKVNNHIAITLANWLATMAMFYWVFFMVLSVLYFQTPKSPLEWVQYIIQTFFQGVALPVLALVAKNEGNKMMRLMEDMHKKVVEELQIIKELFEKFSKREE